MKASFQKMPWQEFQGDGSFLDRFLKLLSYKRKNKGHCGPTVRGNLRVLLEIAERVRRDDP